jgi:hypothetical protein
MGKATAIAVDEENGGATFNTNEDFHSAFFILHSAFIIPHPTPNFNPFFPLLCCEVPL